MDALILQVLERKKKGIYNIIKAKKKKFTSLKIQRSFKLSFAYSYTDKKTSGNEDFNIGGISR